LPPHYPFLYFWARSSVVFFLPDPVIFEPPGYLSLFSPFFFFFSQRSSRLDWSKWFFCQFFFPGRPKPRGRAASYRYLFLGFPQPPVKRAAAGVRSLPIFPFYGSVNLRSFFYGAPFNSSTSSNRLFPSAFFNKSRSGRAPLPPPLPNKGSLVPQHVFVCFFWFFLLITAQDNTPPHPPPPFPPPRRELYPPAPSFFSTPSRRTVRFYFFFSPSFFYLFAATNRVPAPPPRRCDRMVKSPPRFSLVSLLFRLVIDRIAFGGFHFFFFSNRSVGTAFPPVDFFDPSAS